MAQQEFERLLAIIRQLNNQIVIAEQNIVDFQRQFSRTGAQDFNRAMANQTLVLEQLRRELTETQRAYDRLFDSQRRGNTNTVGTPPGPRPPVTVAPSTPAEQRLRAGYSGENLESRKKAEEEALLRSLRHRITSEERYAQALDQARRLGFGPENLIRAQTRGTGGIEQLQFQRYDEGGTQRRFDTFVSPSGRAAPGISNQFRTFGQGVARDIGELTKWSIALAAVYGPMRQLSELTQIMIENQTRLAEATTSVGSTFLDQSGIFAVAAEQAERAGESISGVIDAFTQAYRATGGAGDQVERLAVAQDLLNDSLILSKLSTLDQASAIDTLSAALRQAGSSIDDTNNPLQNGTELLDRWVRVTKVANVDLASLATGFAVLGDAAEAAQINVDQLNGIIAAIGETGVASGRELANTARALVAGFQSDQAREALERVGVAFEDSTGQARPFLEIMQELSDLRQTGILDDTAFSQLTLALGGGTRRQAAFATFIENFDRVQEVADESSRASGDAQAALAKQLETVQTSLTRLGNSFQELAQTLGTEGGFLGIITSSVDGLTSMVKAFDGLTSILGKATPALAAFIATSLILKQQGRGGITDVVSGFGRTLGASEYEGRLRGAGQGLSSALPLPFGQRARGFVGTNVLGTNAASGIFQGLLTAAIPAILNATNKEDRFGGVRATANIVGGIGGGIVGSLVAGSPLIGAAVGTAISEAFVNSTIDRKTDIFGYTAPTLGEPGAAPTTAQDLDEALRQAEINLYKSIGGGNEAIGRLLTPSGEREKELIDEINRAIKEGNKEGFEELLRTSPFGARSVSGQERLQAVGISEELLRQAFRERREVEFRPEFAAFQRAAPEAQEEFRRAEAARLAIGNVPGQEETGAFTQLVKDNKDAYNAIISTIRESSKERLSQERIAGNVRGAEYGRRVQALGGFDTKALEYYTALGDSVTDITGGVDDATKAFEVLNNVITRGPEESLPQLTAIKGEIAEIINLLGDPNAEDRLEQLFGGADEARAKLDELQGTLASIVSDINEQALVSQIQIPEVRGDINKPLTQDEFGQVSQVAKQLQDEFYQGFLQIPDDMYEALQGSWEEWAQIVEDSGDVFFQKVSEIDPQFFQQAMQQLIEQGKLASQQASPFGVQQIDLPGARAGELQSTINYFSKYLAQNFPQYEQKPEEFGVIFNDYVTSVLHGDNLAVKLALEKLVDINQKQLDGMYNIPEGATFWVPLTAAYYRPQSQGGAGGLPDVGDSAIPENTSAVQQNTQALRELSLGFRGDPGYSRKAEELQEQRLAFRGDRGYGRQAEEARQSALGFRGDLGYGRDKRETDGKGFTGIKGAQAGFLTPGNIDFGRQLLELLRNLFTTSDLPTSGRGNRGAGGLLGGQTSLQQNAPTVNAKLDFRIDQNTQLVVDGRVLAQVISPYMAQEMVRLEAAQGTITKRYII